MYAFDRQTDRQMDGQNFHSKTMRLHCMQSHGENAQICSVFSLENTDREKERERETALLPCCREYPNCVQP